MTFKPDKPPTAVSIELLLEEQAGEEQFRGRFEAPGAPSLWLRPPNPREEKQNQEPRERGGQWHRSADGNKGWIGDEFPSRLRE